MLLVALSLEEGPNLNVKFASLNKQMLLDLPLINVIGRILSFFFFFFFQGNHTSHGQKLTKLYRNVQPHATFTQLQGVHLLHAYILESWLMKFGKYENFISKTEFSRTF